MFHSCNNPVITEEVYTNYQKNRNKMNPRKRPAQTSPANSQSSDNPHTSAMSLFNKRSKKTSGTIDELPTELILRIFSNLSHEKKLYVGAICKEWFSLVRDRWLWDSLSFYTPDYKDYIEIQEFPQIIHFAGANITSIDFWTRKSCKHIFLATLLKGLPYLHNVKTLFLPNLARKSSAASFLESIGKNCKELETLEGILRINVTQETAGLIKNDKLKAITLCFQMTKACYFVLAIPANFVNLVELYIETSDDLGLSDKALGALANSSLKLRKFHFAWDYPTTLVGAQHVASMKSLEALSIQLYECQAEGDDDDYFQGHHDYVAHCLLGYALIDHDYFQSIDSDEDDDDSDYMPEDDDDNDDDDGNYIAPTYTLVTEMLEILTKELDLKELLIKNSSGLEEADVVIVAKNLPNLKNLALLDTDLTGEAVINMSKHLSKLEKFSMSWYTRQDPGYDTLYKFMHTFRETLKTVKLCAQQGNTYMEELQASFPAIDVQEVTRDGIRNLPFGIKNFWLPETKL